MLSAMCKFRKETLSVKGAPRAGKGPGAGEEAHMTTKPHIPKGSRLTGCFLP